MSNIVVNLDLILKHFLWSSYFLESRFKTKTIPCSHQLNSDLAVNDDH